MYISSMSFLPSGLSGSIEDRISMSFGSYPSARDPQNSLSAHFFDRLVDFNDLLQTSSAAVELLRYPVHIRHVLENIILTSIHCVAAHNSAHLEGSSVHRVIEERLDNVLPFHYCQSRLNDVLSYCTHRSREDSPAAVLAISPVNACPDSSCTGPAGHTRSNSSLHPSPAGSA